MKYLKTIKNNINLKELLLGSFTTFIIKITGMTLGYIVVLLISRNYGAYGTGVYSLALNLLLSLSVFCAFGLDVMILRYVGQYGLENNNNHKLRNIYYQILSVTIPLSILVAIILYLSSNFITEYFFKNEDYSIILKICAVGLPFFTAGIINVEFLRGAKKIKISEFYRSVMRPLGVFTVLLFLNKDEDISRVIVGLVLAIFLSFVGSLLPVHNIINNISKNIDKQKKHIKTSKLLKEATPMMMIMVVNTLLISLASFMIEWFKTSKEVGVFNVSLKIAQIVSLVLTVVNVIAAPKFAELFWNDKIEELKKFIRYSSKLIFFGCSVMSLFIIIFSRELLLFFGEEFINGRIPLIILVIGQIVNSASGSVGMFMNMTGNQNAFKNIIILVLLFVTVSYLIFIPMFEGVLGAAIVFSLGAVILNVSSVIYVYKKLKIRTYYLPFIR
ncbi:MAG: hypothetical protein CMC05_08895 [Flavobacteriaceae bacterium]|nr:hypothetical protein [Flavobacteriaceae bacterium]